MMRSSGVAWRVAVLLLSVLLLAAFLAAPLAAAHEWYSGLQDGRGLDCCDVRDCAPVAEEDYRWIPGSSPGTRTLEIRVAGRWWPVPDTAWIGVEPPDGRPHACKLPAESFVRCVIWPGQM